MPREKFMEEEEGFDSLYEEDGLESLYGTDSGMEEKTGMRVVSEEQLEEDDTQLLESFSNSNASAIAQNLSDVMERIRARANSTERELAAVMENASPANEQGSHRPALIRERVDALESQFSKMLIMFQALMALTQTALTRIEQLEERDND